MIPPVCDPKSCPSIAYHLLGWCVLFTSISPIPLTYIRIVQEIALHNNSETVEHTAETIINTVNDRNYLIYSVNLPQLRMKGKWCVLGFKFIIPPV